MLLTPLAICPTLLSEIHSSPSGKFLYIHVAIFTTLRGEIHNSI